MLRLRLQVVDEAVFALAEKQPALAKVFFYLEQEVMKPRYEIHSIGMPEIVEPARDRRSNNTTGVREPCSRQRRFVTPNKLKRKSAGMCR